MIEVLGKDVFLEDSGKAPPTFFPTTATGCDAKLPPRWRKSCVYTSPDDGFLPN